MKQAASPAVIAAAIIEWSQLARQACNKSS